MSLAGMMNRTMDVITTDPARGESGDVLREYRTKYAGVPCNRQPRSSAKVSAYLAASEIQWSHAIYWVPGTAEIERDNFLRVGLTAYKVLAAAKSDTPNWPNEALVEEAVLPDGL